MAHIPTSATFTGRLVLETDSGSRDVIAEIAIDVPITLESIREAFAKPAPSLTSEQR